MVRLAFTGLTLTEPCAEWTVEWEEQEGRLGDCNNTGER